MSGFKNVIITLCVCSVCFGVYLMLVNGGGYKKLMKTVFGLTVISILLLSDYKSGKSAFKVPDTESETVGTDFSEYCENMELRIAEAKIKNRLAEILKNHGASVKEITLNMDIDGEGRIVINKAELVLSGGSVTAAEAEKIAETETGLKFTVRDDKNVF